MREQFNRSSSGLNGLLHRMLCREEGCTPICGLYQHPRKNRRRIALDERLSAFRAKVAQRSRTRVSVAAAELLGVAAILLAGAVLGS